MKTILSVVFILFTINITSQAQAFKNAEIESSLKEDGIAKLNSTIFVNQTSTNGVFFKQGNTADLAKIHRLVIKNEVDYIVSNPFILSTEFSVFDMEVSQPIALDHSVTIFPLIED